MKKRGIFIKVFSYTTIFLILLVCVTIALFSQQFLSFYNTSQVEQLYFSYQSLHDRLQGKSIDDILDTVQEFYENNQSFSFYITDSKDNIVFSTPNISNLPDSNSSIVKMTVGNDYILIAANQRAIQTRYGGLISKSFMALAFMLALSVAGAFIFARQMTKPIKQLTVSTKKMANLEDVLPGAVRRDELGDLAHDVHAMYDKLKDEILRRREMEETQRYFFSAASHELKTPIAATSVLLEGMLENIGDYNDHPKYLRECIKLMDVQSKIISEILELVSLDDGKIILNPETLDIGHTVTAALSSFQTLAEANGQSISVEIPENQTCLADAKMLKRVLSNVLLNAVQNTPKDGEIRLWTEPIAGQYRLCVLNKGTRIDPAVLPKLFDPFYRVDKVRNRKDGRSGLGLTIVQKALAAMNIEFALENISDGVLFWMDLPMKICLKGIDTL